MNFESSGGVRRRHRARAETPGEYNYTKADQTTAKLPSGIVSSPKDDLYPSSAYIIRCIILFLVITSLAFLACSRRPAVKTRDVDAEVFSAERAWYHCNAIGHDYKWVGSAGLERAMNYIEEELRSMPGVEVQRQWGSGAYATDLARSQFTVSYGNVTNIVSRVGPKNDDLGSLIVNAHVDSAAGSPGASDDTAAVGIMLELVRNLVASGSLKRQVVFLFNGAEEVVLAGAHAFVTEHPWVENLAALINLEAMGSGKTALLFRQGPGARWLMKAYSRAVEYPFAMSSSNDVHRSGLIPGETDKRIFDEFTEIPSYDFVLFENGYTYHTSSDSMAYLEKEGLQHMGETVHSLILELAGAADAIGKHALNQYDDSSFFERLSTYCNLWAARIGLLENAHDPPVVFYHVWNRLTLTYDLGVMIVLNCTLAVFIVSMWSVIFAIKGCQFFYSCVRTLTIYLLSLFLGTLLAGSAAFILSRGGLSMVWFGKLPLLFALYTPFMIFGLLTGFDLLLVVPREERFGGMIFSLSIFYTSFMLLMTYWGITSAAPVFFYLLPITLMSLIPSISRRSPMLAYFLLSLPFSIFGVPAYHTFLYVLLPVLGRIGQKLNTDVLASVLSMYFGAVSLFNPFLPVLAIAHRRQHERLRQFCLIAGSAVLLYVALFRVPHSTNVDTLSEKMYVGPVAADPRYSERHPKRILALHFQLADSSTSFFHLGATDALPIPQKSIREVLTPASELLWGSLTPRSKLTEPVRNFAPWISHNTTYTVPQNLGLHLESPQVTLSEEITLEPNVRNISFVIHAPCAHQITLRLPINHLKESYISKWSLGSKALQDMGDGGGVFARHVGHGQSGELWKIWVIVHGQLYGDVTSLRFGKSKSDLLSKIHWANGMAPVFMQVRGISFEF